MNNTSEPRDYNHICFTEEELQLVPYKGMLIFIKYIFPIQFLLGVSGNFLNLLVLLSRGMRTKTNIILACIALYDIAFLFTMVMTTLQTFQPFYTSVTFRKIYHNTKNSFNALTNWFSAGSIWFIMTVTVERLCVIKFPLKARFYWKPWKLATVIIVITLVSFVIPFYNHYAYYFEPLSLCNGTQIVYQPWSVVDIPTTPNSLKLYIKVSTVVNTIFVVVIPLVALIILNCGLIVVLRTQHKTMFGGFDNQSGDKRTNSNRAKSSERKVSAMVAAIVTTFVLTNVPSMIVTMWHFCHAFKPMSKTFYIIATASNSLVITGKVLNFFLYCTSSANFRQNLFKHFLSQNSKLGRFLVNFSEQTRSTLHTTHTLTTRSRRESNMPSGECTPLRDRGRSVSQATEYRLEQTKNSLLTVRNSMVNVKPGKSPEIAGYQKLNEPPGVSAL